jgi:hypothetical protein
MIVKIIIPKNFNDLNYEKKMYFSYQIFIYLLF